MNLVCTGKTIRCWRQCTEFEVHEDGRWKCTLRNVRAAAFSAQDKLITEKGRETEEPYGEVSKGSSVLFTKIALLLSIYSSEFKMQ